MVGNIVEAGLKHEQNNREVQVPNTALPPPQLLLSQLSYTSVPECAKAISTELLRSQLSYLVPTELL
jgi:hypothetical protein